MAKIRINPEELELLEEDQKPDSGRKLLDFVRENSQIIGGVVIVILLVVAFIGYSDYSDKQDTIQANILLNEAYTEYQEAQASTTWSSEERQTAMAEVISLADNIIAEYPETPIALEAEFLKGTAYYQSGNDVQEIIDGGAANNQAAINSFTSYLQKVESGSFEEARGALALAYAHENNYFISNDVDAGQEAVGFFSRAESIDPYGFLRVDAMLGRARILAKSNNTEDAITIYRQILDERFESMDIPDDLQNEDGTFDTGKQILFSYKQFSKLTTSLTNVARIELARLGVDVDEEYPLYNEEDLNG